MLMFGGVEIDHALEFEFEIHNKGGTHVMKSLFPKSFSPLQDFIFLCLARDLKEGAD